MRTKKIKKLGKKEMKERAGVIPSLVRSSIFQYEMLMSLQQQVLCLEAKIKMLEARR
jgi:hypothetical protein